MVVNGGDKVSNLSPTLRNAIYFITILPLCYIGVVTIGYNQYCLFHWSPTSLLNQ